MEKSIPTGIKIITILGYILIVIFIILGLAFILGGQRVIKILSDKYPSSEILSFVTFLTIIGLILILFGVGGVFICRGLWQGKQWARISTIIFTILFSIGTMIYINQVNKRAIIPLAIEACIFGYLFSKGVRKAFR